ncbi:MAG: TlpA family protein disulfide reductase [Gammaproteobacteria bacterium]
MKPRLLRIIRTTAILGCFALGGFYAGQWFWSETPPAEIVAATGQLVDELPDFTLTDLDGRERNIREWSGQPLLLNFWATWCAPCLREMPLLQTLHQESPDGLKVIGIAVDRAPAVESFIIEAGISYPILVGQQQAIAAAESFGPEFIALPFSILIAADGAVIGMEAGELEVEELRSLAGLIREISAGSLTVEAARERFPGS